MAMK
jgi:hypothetical protein